MNKDEDVANMVNWVSAATLTSLWVTSPTTLTLTLTPTSTLTRLTPHNPTHIQVLAQLCIYARECYAYSLSTNERPTYLDQGKFASNRIWKPLEQLPQIDLWGR